MANERLHSDALDEDVEEQKCRCEEDGDSVVQLEVDVRPSRSRATRAGSGKVTTQKNRKMAFIVVISIFVFCIIPFVCGYVVSFIEEMSRINLVINIHLLMDEVKPTGINAVLEISQIEQTTNPPSPILRIPSRLQENIAAAG